MYARSAIAKTVNAKSTGRNPGAASKLFFTSTGNTVAAIRLRAKKPPYHLRTETVHDVGPAPSAEFGGFIQSGTDLVVKGQ